MALTLIHHRSCRVSRATLMRAVDRGELLRLQPGGFAETWQWVSAKPWTRHLGMTAAVGLKEPTTTFCRETARREDAYLSALSAHPVRRCLPPVPQHLSAPESRNLYWSSATGPGGIRVAVPEVGLEDGSDVEVTAEPVAFALMDTLPRLSRQRAVVALDAALAGRYGFGRRVSRDAAASARRRHSPARLRLASRACGRRIRRADQVRPGEDPLRRHRSWRLLEPGVAPGADQGHRPRSSTLELVGSGGPDRLRRKLLREGVSRR